MPSRKILLLNDDPDLQELYEFLFDLYRWDYTVISSENELVESLSNDILFIDSNNIDFLYSSLNSIKNKNFTSKTIISTVSPYDKVVEDNLPSSKRLVKPFSVKLLRNTISQVNNS